MRSPFRPELAVLIAAAAATRFTGLFRPDAVIFDEVYFKAFAGHYLDHAYFFDIHPPLAKLILAGWAALLHIPAADMVAQGVSLPLMRVLPALAGTLIIPVFWWLLRLLGARRLFATLGALALLLDNALLVESRLIVTDPFLLLFGLSAICFFLMGRKRAGGRGEYLWYGAAGLMAGATASVKWTGLTALGVIGLVWLMDLRGRFNLKRFGIGLAALILPAAVIYVASFAAHFALLTRSGDGDAFMSSRFQATLPGNASYDPAARMGFFDKFIELNHEMYSANKTLTATHPYGSQWYTWPLELRPIYYWQGTTLPDGRQGNIYLLGNPAVWWGVIAAAVTGLVYARARHIRLKPETKVALSLTGLAYLANYLPFVGVTRVMFLYHYFFSFIFSVAVVILLWDDLAGRGENRDGRHGRQVYLVVGAIALVVAAGFIYFAPLSYGSLLSPAGLQARMWLPSWR